ncbi:MAG TPA: hypothetical protein VH054_13455 [Polyangiaceae bacterium]|jgi:hypothetical protein|nr:hypothetical protein [Polyangiaceae bacterium]
MTSQRVVAVVWIAFAAACGARTGLLAPEESDASVDAALDAHDAKKDTADALDALDVQDAPEDVVFPDVPILSDCPDAGDTLVYVLGAKNELYSFYPPTLTFSNIGTIACPSSSGPNSMAVTRSGIAFTNFHDGNLFEVSTANAACKPTTYKPAQLGWTTYGMGYAGIADGGEDLYVSGNGGITALGLGVVDTTAFTLSSIGAYQPQQFNCELTGTGAGQLFGFCPFGTGSYVIEIDPATAKAISSHQLSAGSNATSFAFAFWGGTFWIFTGNGSSLVTNYDPNAQTETNVTHAPLEIVGAGVSTCAPL